ncbi:MAG: GNAT family N-acetyltransferase [Myxococcaceae bacterium]|nr:GNAT family N-acetyltransferase [Myxococcaceae bacterium]
MTMKQVGEVNDAATAVLPPDLGNEPDLAAELTFHPPTDEDMNQVASLRASSEPWASRGEKPEQSLEALTKLRPFIQVAKLRGDVVGYVTVERDGPVQGAAYMRNIVVKPDLRQRKLGTRLLEQAMQTARDMHRRTLALRVDPANGPAVSFYRANGFTTVATVVSKKSGKLRLLMSREL